MKFIKSTEADLDSIMEIIKQAQAYFKANGIDQWQNNYPNLSTISHDIAHGHSHILIKDNQVVATAAISFDGEKNYNQIEAGSWLTGGDYAVIHRIAVDNRYKGTGLSSDIIKEVEQLCLEKGVHSIKVDTHQDNKSMQKLLQKNNFTSCGIIYVEDGSPRIAFEKVLGENI